MNRIEQCKEVLQSLKKGGKIHIKKSQRGSFTKYCKGKVTNECIQRGKNSPNPKIRRKAVFAQNARRWKHQDGGILFNYPNRNPENLSERIANLVGIIKQVPMSSEQRDSLERDRRNKEDLMTLLNGIESRKYWWKLSPTWNTPMWNSELLQRSTLLNPTKPNNLKQDLNKIANLFENEN